MAKHVRRESPTEITIHNAIPFPEFPAFLGVDEDFPCPRRVYFGYAFPSLCLDEIVVMQDVGGQSHTSFRYEFPRLQIACFPT